MSGFISIERDLWDHPLFAPSEMSEREAWCWMIARAAWAGTTHRIGSDVVQIERGQFMATLRQMQSAFMWGSDKRVRNFLKKLEKHGMIAVLTLGERNARKTHVTICNYNEYQSSGRSKDAAKTHEGRTTDAVNKQGNKVTIEDTNVSSSAKRGNRLSQDWFLPKEWGEWAIGEGWPAEVIRTESEKFKDYWHSVAGAKGVKLDWFATWRNWMRNNPKTQNLKAINGGSNGRPASKSQQHMDAFIAGARS